MAPLLEVRDLTLRRDDGTGAAILNNINVAVEEGEVLVLKGQSGCGKTTLLKCIAELNVYQKGEVLLRGKTAKSYGIPNFRTRVQYVPQRPSILPGTPLQFLEQARNFSARKARCAEVLSEGKKIPDPLALADEWGVPRTLWAREWSTLSGGEGQRIALALAIGLGGADVLLLDEPTSALDIDSTLAVEKSLVSMLPSAPLNSANRGSSTTTRKGTGPRALIWITHAAEQADRVGTREMDLTHQ